MKAAMVSLGCAKNLVNSEQMLYQLKEAGWTLISDTAQADVNIINTCGFLESARQEAVDHILELTQLPGKIIVAGCLTELVKDEIFQELPEVSGIIGCGSYDRIAEAAAAVMEGRRFAAIDPADGKVSETPRLVTGCNGESRPDGGISAKSTYLKISEGCSNHCAYCLIPTIRGSYASRTMDAIIDEARSLTESGVLELILVAQDLTRYGRDIAGHSLLPELLVKLCELPELRWLRLHYLYPDDMTGELIDVIARENKIVKYLDIPIQHCTDDMLRAMNRRGSQEKLEQLISHLRARIPGLVLRTTLITGFPGETEQHHTQLMRFLKKHKLERVGVFCYSAEPGTKAYDLPYQVPEDIKLRRQEQLISVQQDIMDAYNESRVGRELEVFCEGFDRLAETYYGRSYAESPDVDGKVFFTSGSPVQAGAMVCVKITGTEDGDLFGRVGI